MSLAGRVALVTGGGRVCQPEDVANVVRFLVSNENSYLTGERLYCDGGGQNLR